MAWPEELLTQPESYFDPRTGATMGRHGSVVLDPNRLSEEDRRLAYRRYVQQEAAAGRIPQGWSPNWMPPTELQSQKTMPATMEVTGTQPMSTMKIPGGPLSDMPDRLRVVKELSDPFRNIGPTVGSSTGVSERNFAPFPDDFPLNRQKPPVTEQKAINDNELRKAFLRQSMNPDDLLTTPEEWKVAEADVLNTPAGNMRRFNTDQIRADNALMRMHRLDQEARSQGQPSPTAIAAADQYYGADPNMAARHAANGDKLAKDWLARRMSLERPSEVAAMQQYERFRTGDESDPAVARAMQLQKKYQAPLGSVAERPLSDKAEARRMLLRNARGGDVGLTGDAEAELAGVSRNTRNYAQDLAERKARAAMRGLERGAVREARRGNLGPMQDLAGTRGGANGAPIPGMVRIDPMTMSPQQQNAAAQWNLQLLQNQGVVEAERVRAGAESGRRTALDRQKRSELVSQYAGAYLGQVAAEHPNWTLQQKADEARKMAEASVPPIGGDTTQPVVGPSVPQGILPRDMPAGGIPLTNVPRGESVHVVPQDVQSNIRDMPGKSKGGDIRDIVLAFPDGTPTKTIRDTLRSKGWSDTEIDDFRKSSGANYGWILGVGGARKNLKARNMLGRPTDWIDAAEQALPIVGPIAGDLSDAFGL